MLGYILIPVGIGVGLGILKTYKEYKQNKKLKETSREIVSLCKSIERKIEQMPTEKLRRIFWANYNNTDKVLVKNDSVEGLVDILLEVEEEIPYLEISSEKEIKKYCEEKNIPANNLQELRSYYKRLEEQISLEES